ncbi:MAG: hypothetical protein IKQ31_05170 [Clostridia bacterium]|nr:hypothetical protein [Clostridia bacterium]
MNLWISCDIDVVVQINNEKIGTISQFHPKIYIETDETEIYLTSFPLQTSSTHIILPYSIKLLFYQGKLHCSDESSFIVQFSTNTFGIKLFPHQISKPNTTDIYIEHANFSFSMHNGIACFSSKSQSIFYPIMHHITDVKIEMISNKIFLHANTNSLKFALILDENLRILFDGTADKIEFDGTKVITLINLNTIAQHGKVCIYTLNNMSFVKTDSYTVYLQSSPIPPACKEALPIAFLEAITLKDISLARQYLHPNLNAILKTNALTEFFGDFVSFTNLDNDPYFVTLIYEGNPKHVKNYYFTVLNNLITNITLI